MLINVPYMDGMVFFWGSKGSWCDLFECEPPWQRIFLHMFRMTSASFTSV